MAVVLVLFAAAILRAMAFEAPFDYDESVYALKGRNWLSGGTFPTSGWAPYRGPALPAISWVIGHFTFEETPYKVVGLIAGLGLLLGVWALGRRTFGPAAAVIAVAAIAAGSELQVQTVQYLTDVPTAALLTLMSLVIWRALEDEPARWSLLWLGPIAFLIYSLRYGAAPVIGISLLIGGLVYRRQLLARPRIALATVGAIAVAALPHLVFALRTFGTPWGALSYTLDLAHKDSATNGLGSYIQWLPSVIVGRAGGTLAVIGVVATIVTLVRAGARWGAHERATALVGGIAIVDILVLGIAAPSQPRYIFFPGAMLALMGADAVVRAARALTPQRLHKLLAAAAAVTLLTMIALGTRLSFRRWERYHIPHRVAVKEVGLLIKQRVSGEPCGVLSTALPQITWYSGCFTSTFGVPPDIGAERNLPPGRRFLILVDGVRGEPTPEQRAVYLRMAQPTPFYVGYGDHVLTAYELVR